MSFEIVTRTVVLNGLNRIMFDRFLGQEEIPVEQKLYLAPDNETLVLPATNVMGFLASKSSNSCLRQFTDSKNWKVLEPVIRSSVVLQPDDIPLLNDDEPIPFTDWNDKLHIDSRMARPSATARVIAKRPILELPWKLAFTLSINESEKITEAIIRDWFERGGFMVGLGAGTTIGFGRFVVETWE